MEIQMFNGWYFFWIILSIAGFIGLYFLLKKRSEKTKKIVLFSILAFALLLHFLKAYIPPYSTDVGRLYRDSWFINICGANIALFPILFFTKSKYAKDYMFYIGILGGLIAVLYPVEPIENANQAAEWMDVIRFYIHHNILWYVPLLMVIFKMHKLSYRRVLALPITFCAVMIFIMINQILQSELGFIALRDSDFFDINYKNSSMIWGPSGGIGEFLAKFCPDIFKTVPVGQYAGQTKYWPLIWLICPMYVLIVPIAFGMSMIFDYKHFETDLKNCMNYIKLKFQKPSSDENEESMKKIMKILKR